MTALIQSCACLWSFDWFSWESGWCLNRTRLHPQVDIYVKNRSRKWKVSRFNSSNSNVNWHGDSCIQPGNGQDWNCTVYIQETHIDTAGYSKYLKPRGKISNLQLFVGISFKHLSGYLREKPIKEMKSFTL